MADGLDSGLIAALWSAAWQSSVLLAIGLAACHAWSRRPARAHRALVLAMAASLMTVPMSWGVGRLGWGFLRSTPARAIVASPAMPTSTQHVRIPAPSNTVTLAPAQATTADGEAPAPSANRAVATAAPVQRPGETPSMDRVLPGFPVLGWKAIAVCGWVGLSTVMVGRLLASAVLGHRVVRRARPLGDSMLVAAARTAAARIGLGVETDLRESRDVRCPVVWCWGVRPRVLVPVQLLEVSAAFDWVGVLSHELAHWKRCDHVAGLVAELTVCVWPWNPLAWWAREQLREVSETACDDWVVAGGQPAFDYAESLLGLVPQRSSALALAAVTRRAGLVRRLEHLLDRRPKQPTTGRVWSTASALLAVLAVSALALAQTAPGRKASEPGEARKKRPTQTVGGVVLAPDGTPARQARVIWIGTPKPSLSFSAQPKGHESDTWAERILTQTRTDDQGRFRVEATFEPNSYLGTLLFVTAPNAGLFAQRYKPGTQNVTLRLSPEVPIEGRLLSPAGMPAAGVKVTMRGFFDGSNPESADTNGLYIGRGRRDTEPLDFWPATQTTGSDGRFTIHGLPKGGMGSLEFEHPDFAIDELQVSTTMVVTPSMKAFEIRPVPPQFTHTLEPARPVAGVVTDKATGKPLANVLVEMTPMRRHGGMPFTTRTDDQGRYRVSGHQADMFFTHVVPDPSQGYLPGNDVHQGWPAGARVLEKNFALAKGKLLTGRVIDEATRKPIAGASVVYQPSRGNKANKNYDLRNPVVCDADGRFTITGLPGAGLLVVETSLPDAIRVPLVPKMRGETRSAEPWFPHGYATVDVPESGEPASVEIVIRHGKTLRARALGPDGKPLPEVTAYCAELNARQINNWPQGQKFEGGVFELPGAEPGRTYRVYFLHPGRKLGTVADLVPKADGSDHEVRLEPMAQVHGKLVNADGSPVASGGAYPLISWVDHPETLGRNETLGGGMTEIYVNLMGEDPIRFEYGGRNTADKGGTFVNDLLIPGARFVIVAHSGGGQREAFVSVAPLRPGEDRDLGNVTLKEPKP